MPITPTEYITGLWFDQTVGRALMLYGLRMITRSELLDVMVIGRTVSPRVLALLDIAPELWPIDADVTIAAIRNYHSQGDVKP